MKTHTKIKINVLLTIIVHNVITTPNIMESKSLQRNDTQQTDKNIYSLAILRETAVFIKKKTWSAVNMYSVAWLHYLSIYQ